MTEGKVSVIHWHGWHGNVCCASRTGHSAHTPFKTEVLGKVCVSCMKYRFWCHHDGHNHLDRSCTYGPWTSSLCLPGKCGVFGRHAACMPPGSTSRANLPWQEEAMLSLPRGECHNWFLLACGQGHGALDVEAIQNKTKNMFGVRDARAKLCM